VLGEAHRVEEIDGHRIMLEATGKSTAPFL
jgi:hypothetical protein